MAGWAIPASTATAFAGEGSHLARYASRLGAVEINSSFYRPHRRSTYERWAVSVPDGFRFAVKLPRTITHDRRLIGCADLLARFSGEVAGLGGKRGPVLMQLPPSLRFDPVVARSFLAEARDLLGGTLACEPRHPSWFEVEADTLLAGERIARVMADPPVVPAGSRPGGWAGLSYLRLHGTPRIYWSDYPATAIADQVRLVCELSADGRKVWTIFDNTAAGHAPANALALMRDLP